MFLKTHLFLSFFVRASGEAILDTQRYLDSLYSTFSYVKFYSTFSYVKFVSASGEAISGTQRYLQHATRGDNSQDHRPDYPRTSHKHFIQPLYPSTLSNIFIQALYPSTLSNIFVQLTYRGEVLRSITCYGVSYRASQYLVFLPPFVHPFFLCGTLMNPS